MAAALGLMLGLQRHEGQALFSYDKSRCIKLAMLSEEAQAALGPILRSLCEVFCLMLIQV
jgi:hypothetical protein